MTTTEKQLRRETLAMFRGTPLVIELHQTWLAIRLKGRRYRYEVSYEQIWKLGAENAARAAREEKAAKKKLKKDQRAH